MGFPTAPFTVLIDVEIVEVTEVSGNTWTVSPMSDSHAIQANVVRQGIVRVADTQSVLPSGDPRGIVIPAESYLPIIESIAGIEHVIGFGKLFDEMATTLPTDSSDFPFELRVERTPNAVAAHNATAVFLGFESDSSLDMILNSHDEYDGNPATVPFTSPLTAPSLVRTID